MNGHIYIMTNPALKGMVKIGYATDVEARRKQLSTTALPYPYEIYATYKTESKLEDKTLHKLIDTLNPDLRISSNREFFLMEAEEAFELLRTIAVISNTEDKLEKMIEEKSDSKQRKRPPVNFVKCGIPVGAELVYIEDEDVRVRVVDERKVEWNNEITSLSSLTGRLKGVSSIQGPAYFKYNGELITDIAERTQYKDIE